MEILDKKGSNFRQTLDFLEENLERPLKHWTAFQFLQQAMNVEGLELQQDGIMVSRPYE